MENTSPTSEVAASCKAGSGAKMVGVAEARRRGGAYLNGEQRPRELRVSTKNQKP